MNEDLATRIAVINERNQMIRFDAARIVLLLTKAADQGSRAQDQALPMGQTGMDQGFQ
ncbi:MAG: hypothetical protein ACXW3C_06560 [Pyrinomonadaceae bacterium]